MSAGARLSSVLAAGLLSLAGTGVAAAEASGDIGLSADGVVWSDALVQPLFDPAERWVPGDARTASFHIRNEGPSAARLMIAVRGATGAGLLGPDEIEIAARAAGSEWLLLQNGIASDWLTVRAIERGGQVRITLRVSFLRSASNGAMLERLPLDVKVTLVDAEVSGAVSDSTLGSGLLPEAGSALRPFLVQLGVVLLSGGLLLLSVGRRRRSAQEKVRRSSAVTVVQEVTVDG